MLTWKMSLVLKSEGSAGAFPVETQLICGAKIQDTLFAQRIVRKDTATRLIHVKISPTQPLSSRGQKKQLKLWSMRI